jgi:hypothetical protein
MPQRYFARLLLPALTLLLVAVPSAQGEQIQWSYAGEVNATGPSADLGPKVLVSASRRTDGSMGRVRPPLDVSDRVTILPGSEPDV